MATFCPPLSLFLLSVLLEVLVGSCSGIQAHKNIAHLQDRQFLANNPLPRQFGDYPLYERMRHYKVPGISVAVVMGGRIVWAEGFGRANVEKGAAVTPATLFQAASVSKPVAALGLLRLVEQERINLEADVNTYLKEYQVPGNGYTGERKVNLRAILGHVSGVNVAGFGGYSPGAALPSTTEVLQGKGNSPAVEVTTLPESRWQYSGGGYTVLQKVIEEVSGQSFDAFMQAEILQPLGMHSSTFAQPLPQRYHSRASSAYTSAGELIDGRWHNYPEKAAAGLWTTPSDLARYCIGIQQLLSGKVAEGFLSRATLTMMLADHFSLQPSSHSPDKPANAPQYWGLGPEIIGSGKKLRFQHGGRNEGFKAHFTAYAYQGQAIVLMANADGGYELLMEVEQVLSDYYGMEFWPEENAAP